MALDISGLIEDGDMIELEGGSFLRLKVSPDEYTSINDFDCYGEIEQYSHTYWVKSEISRPKHFTGNAEKLHLRSDWIWWEPPADGPQRSDPEFRGLRNTVKDLFEFGFRVVTLELCRGIDAYGRHIVRDVTSMGGCVFESEPNGYSANEAAKDLLWELGLSC